MKHLLHRPSRRKAIGRLTALERRTQRKYDACIRRGGHVPSGRYIERDYLGMPHSFWICARCDVPQRSGLAVSGWAA